MSLDIDFGQLLQVVSVVGGVAVILFKIGARDQQFRDILEQVREIASRQNSHTLELGQLQAIVNGMLQMQKVGESEREQIRHNIESAFRRLEALEARKHKAVVDS